MRTFEFKGIKYLRTDGRGVQSLGPVDIPEMTQAEYDAYSIEDRLTFSARMSSASVADCRLMDEAAEEIRRLRQFEIKPLETLSQRHAREWGGP